MTVVVALYILFFISVALFILYAKGKLNELSQENKGYRLYYDLVSRWIVLKNQGRRISEYCFFYNISRVAIYGAGPIGEMVFQELIDDSIEVVYIVDRVKKRFEVIDTISVIPPSAIANQADVDLIIVSSIIHKGEIIESLCAVDLPKRTKIISLDDIVNYLIFHK